MRLYPRLPFSVAAGLAERLRSVDIASAVAASATTHSSALYAPTGGSRVTEDLLLGLQRRLREAAAAHGYPEPTGDRPRILFDRVVAGILFDVMEITPAEASHAEVWQFLTCVLVPDLVRWRFSGGIEGTSRERFLGGARGLRNALGRLWWRAYTLYDYEGRSNHRLFHQLGEDEMVQVMERPSIAGSIRLAREVLLTYLDSRDAAGVPRADLLRDVTKRVRRILPVTIVDLLDQDTLHDRIVEEFRRSSSALRRAVDRDSTASRG